MVSNMTNEEKITLVRVLGAWDTDEEDFSDEILLAYLNIAGRKIIDRAYPFDSTVTIVPERYETLQCEIAVYLLNKRGAEGETSHSENGISRSYENADVPSSMLSVVTPFVGVL
jgi:hypothetical protein